MSRFYRETGFKKTEIGEIPKEWEVVRLKEVARIRRGRVPSNVSKIAFIPMELIPDDHIYVSFRMREIKDVSSYTYCEAGDLLLAKITPCLENGKQGIVPEDVPHGFALATTEVYPLVSNVQKIHKLFLFYTLKFSKYRRILEFSMRGTTGRQRVPRSAVENLIIGLPPLQEQKKIAEVLSALDEAIQTIDEAIARTERLKKGLMQELLTKGIGHREFKETEIGRIPKEWEVAKVKDKFYVETGTTPSTKRKEYWENGVINWFTPIDLSKLNGKMFLEESERKITRKALEDAHLTVIPRGSILISTRAPVGYVAVLKKEGAFNQGCKGLVPKNPQEICSEFYSYYFTSIRRILESLSGGSTFKELSKKMLENLVIPLPPIREQKKIAEILLTIDAVLENKRRKKEKLGRMKRALMNLLLTGKVRVRT